MTRPKALFMTGLLLLPAFAAAQKKGEPDVPRQPKSVAAPAPTTDAEAEALIANVPRHRYAFAGAGLMFLGAMGLSYVANGQGTFAADRSNARDHRREVESTRAAAASANMLYALAGVTLAYGIALEFLPKDLADKADPTIRF